MFNWNSCIYSVYCQTGSIKISRIHPNTHTHTRKLNESQKKMSLIYYRKHNNQFQRLSIARPLCCAFWLWSANVFHILWHFSWYSGRAAASVQTMVSVFNYYFAATNHCRYSHSIRFELPDTWFHSQRSTIVQSLTKNIFNY